MVDIDDGDERLVFTFKVAYRRRPVDMATEHEGEPSCSFVETGRDRIVSQVWKSW